MNLPVSSTRTPTRFKFTPIALLLQGILGTGLTLVAGAAMGQEAGTQGSNVLQEVVVTGEAEAIGNLQKTYAGGQIARGGDLGLLGRTDQMNVPFSTTNYTSELLQNQQARTMSDVVMNDASVRPLAARGGFDDELQIRGFVVSQDDTAVNGLYGMSPATTIPLEMIERVEVLKGPGALTNGIGPDGSVGGSVNLVTKRATDTPLTRVTATYMSDAQFGVHLDMGRRFGEENQWGVRVNTVTRGGEGNIEGGEQNLNLGSLALDYHSRRLRWSLDAWAAQGETKEMRPQTRFTGTSVPAPPDGSLNFKPGTAIDDNTRSVLSRLEYDITDNTTVYGGMGYMHNYYQQDLPTGTGADASGNFNVGNAWWDEDIKTKSADIGVRTRFKTGGVGHTLALGANFLDQERGYFYTSSATTNPSNLYDPAPLPEITVARLDPEKYQANEQSSVAVADTLSFADEKVLLTLGLRRQNIQQDAYNPATGAHTSHYDASATTPLAGLVVKPLKNVSLYGNYTAGLTRGGQAGASTANAGETFAPQRSKQYEAGVKVDWGKLTTQVALYQIERPNSITDPVTNVYSFGGEQRNRGLELTAYGEVQRGLRLLTSMAFIDAELTRTQGGVDQGNTATGVPDFNYNLGLDWDMPWVRGLSLNGRVVGTSEVYMNTANTMTMDGWTRGDVGARYVTEVLGTPMVLRGSVENVTNEKYWLTGLNGYSTLGAPRTYMVSATFDF